MELRWPPGITSALALRQVGFPGEGIVDSFHRREKRPDVADTRWRSWWSATTRFRLVTAEPRWILALKSRRFKSHVRHFFCKALQRYNSLWPIELESCPSPLRIQQVF